MLRFLIKLPLRILAFPVWLAVTVINTIGIFLVGLASWIFYLIAGVAVIAALGCVAKAPEIREITTQKGETEVARFPLVVRRNRTNKAFVVMITAYGGNAGFVQKYLEKGTKVTICGELVISQVKNEENGTASYFTEIIMDTMEFAESKSKRESGGERFEPAKRANIPFEIPEEMEQEMPFR